MTVHQFDEDGEGRAFDPAADCGGGWLSSMGRLDRSDSDSYLHAATEVSQAAESGCEVCLVIRSDGEGFGDTVDVYTRPDDIHYGFLTELSIVYSKLGVDCSLTAAGRLAHAAARLERMRQRIEELEDQQTELLERLHDDG